MADADKIMHPQHFGTDSTCIGSGLIRKSGFASRIIFGLNFGVGGGLRSLSALVVFVVTEF